MADELEKMFSDFGERKQAEKRARDDKAAKHQEFKEKASRIISQEVAPVLFELSADLNDRGHESKVSLLVETHAYPSAQMTFRICDEQNSFTNVSTLFFQTTRREDDLEVRQKIWGKGGREEGISDGGSHSKPLSNVTPEWVRGHAMSFIKSVLDKH